MADTGCQSCLASMKVIRRLGLCEDDLIQVTMCMHTANNNGIKILGAVILRFSSRSKPGQTLETRQIAYVTSDSDKLLLSREACTALGMISENYPTVGEALQVSTEMELDVGSDAAGQTPAATVPHTPECAHRTLQLPTSPDTTTQAHPTTLPSHRG